MVFKVAEPTLGPEIANLLESFLGCKIAREGVLPDRKQFDFFLFLNGSKVVVELEIGGLQKLPFAIAQAEGYKETMGADGIIAIVYPDEARREVTKPDDVKDIALGLRPAVMVLCPFLKDYYPQISLAELAKNLKDSLTKPALAPPVDLVVEALRQSVQGISLEVRRSAGMDTPIIKETIGSLALFEILSQESKEATKKVKEEVTISVVADLAAYILVNQILLHHILSKTLTLPRRLEHVSSPAELNAYFKEVQAIDYKAVYCIDIASNIPLAATNEINVVIMAMRAIQPENLRHDLLGRIFHQFLPLETRKRMGAFYTRPQAAEMLAGLAIDRADERVLDPACGSGTLLVSAYRKKSSIGKARSHRKLVEEELTGVDVMPFAAHLAALNLTMQSPKEVTNKTRIGIGNSLLLVRGSEIGDVARWMKAFGGEVTGADTEQPFTKGEVFTLEPVNLVIMNPPFTRKERLTPGMKGIGLDIFGEQNYWAYFIALADSLLRKNGKIAAVLPRDFFRGEYSRAVREFLFREGRYSLRYVVKTTKDWAFSENALFRDFLIVIQKGGGQAKCAFVYLKKRLSEISVREALGIPITVRLVDEGTEFEDESLSVVWREQGEVWTNWQDLGHLVAFSTKDGEKLLRRYREFIATAAQKLIAVADSKEPVVPIIRGFEHGGENLQSLLYVVRPLAQKRLVRSALVLVSEDNEKSVVVLKDGKKKLEIPLGFLKRGLRTSAYVPRMDVGKCGDYVILRPFEDFEDMLRNFGVKPLDFVALNKKAQKRFTHLVLNRRFDLTAPGTQALAFFSDDKVLPVGLHWSVLTDRETSKVLCLWFNSVFYLLELILSHTETRGSFMLITEEQVRQLHIPNLASCDTSDLLAAFEQVRYAEFPPLVQQFENPPEARQTIDRAVLKTIGYGDKEIDALLSDIYQAMATEMRSWYELMHQSAAKEKGPSLQLHLLPTGL